MIALRKHFSAALLFLAGCAPTHVLSDADFARVSTGMPQAEVRSVLGDPAWVESFPRLHQLAWNYEYVDLWGYNATYAVIFDASGRVSEKHSIRKIPPDQ